MRALLTWLGQMVVQRPVVVLGASLLPCLLLSVYAAFVPSDLSFTGLTNRSDPNVARYFEVSRKLELGGTLLLLLEGPEERLDGAVASLAPALRAHPAVKSVVTEVDTGWFRDRAPWIVDRPVFDGWLRLATHPEDTENARWLVERLEALERDLARTRRSGVRLLVVTMTRDPLDLAAGGAEYFGIEAETRRVLEPLGVSGAYTGLAAMGAQDQSRTLQRVSLLTPLSLLLVLLLFRSLERRVLRMASVAVPLMFSVGATLGIIGLLTGTLTLMETFFGMMVFGLGVDFAIHLIVRHQEELSRGLRFGDALQRALRGAGPGIVSGAATTAGSFLIVAFAPEPTALHLGLSGAIGLISCLVLMLTALPALWILLERRAPSLPSASAGLLSEPVQMLARHATRRPHHHVAAAAALVFISVLGLPRFQFETDMQRVFNRQVPSVQAATRVQELFGINAGPWMVVADSLEEARQVASGFRASPSFGRVESITDLLREDAPQRAQLLRTAADDVEFQLEASRTMAHVASAEEAEALTGLQRLLEALQRAQAVGPPRLEEIPAAVRRGRVTEDGKFVVTAYTARASLDGLVAKADREAAQRVHPDATGLGVILESMMAAERPWVLWIFLGILLFVSVILALDFRSLKWVSLSVVPVLVGTVSTVGLMCWMDISFNLLTSVVVPLIIGLGVDDGIHVVHRLREDPDEPVHVATGAVARGVLMTTATTCASFVVLMFTDHPGMESMGLVMLIGMPICMLASVSTLPALAVLLDGRRNGGPGQG